MKYVSLHNHTFFSILDALSSPKELLQRAKELGQPAIAITDHGSLACVWDAYKASKDIGVKYIVGCEFYFVNDVNHPDEKIRHVVLLAKNAIGYRNILLLSRGGFDHSIFYGKKTYPLIDWNDIKTHAEGVICLTSCGSGIVSQLLNSKKTAEAEETALKLIEIYGDNLGIEIQANNLKRYATAYNDSIDQRFTNYHLIKLAEKLNIRIVPTTNSHYLTPEDAPAHDVLLAIGAGQSIYSNARLKYEVPQFYVRSAEEVREFFVRTHPEDQVDKWIANSIYFADLCEDPKWVDPKYSNPSGKELPEFPVKDEADYQEYLTWLSSQPENIQQLEADKSFLRYRCDKNFSKILSDHEMYRARLEEEFHVIEFHGFSSYMLITADYIDWARKNNIRVGVGRGCLTKDALVLTAKGFQNLNKIKINDEVYTHTGQLQKVTNRFEFDVSKETLLKIETTNSFNDITLTSDHKVYIQKCKETDVYKRRRHNKCKSLSKTKRWENTGDLGWVKAEELSVGDKIFTPHIIRNINHNNIPSDFVVNFSSTKNSNLDKNVIIPIDDNFLYFIGRFVGDGWVRVPNKNGYDGYAVGIAFNSNDIHGIERFKKYFDNLGLNPKFYKSKTKNLVQMMVHNKSLALKVKEMLPLYKNCSRTKHLPAFFRELPNSKLKKLLAGLIDSDGSKKSLYKKDNRISIDTTSHMLVCEIKEALLYLGVRSSICTRKPFLRGTYKCRQSFKIRFKFLDFANDNNQLGYFSIISKISKVKEKTVYDITTENDHSYVTTNGAVHNSVGGSLIGYLLDIHRADPIKYKLIFARFHNVEKTSFPDIDTDFASSRRDEVKAYVRKKYGEDHVVHVSNINTITPKVYARDIARSCELGGSRESAVKVGNDVADSLSADIKTMDKAFEESPLFSAYAKKYPQFEKFKAICGKYRAWATHAGGIIISKRPLAGLVPLRKDKDGAIAIEYDKDRAEENGLVKMDMLAVETLDIIDETVKLIKASGKTMVKEPFPYHDYDKKTYDLLGRGDTFCVFQLGTSGGTIDLCKKVKPQSIEDISAINSLCRPSARDIREDYIKTKEGTLPFELLHPSLERAFGGTYGFGLYEECLMYLAQDVAGWSLHEADRLRKLTKEKGKNPKKAAQWRQDFINDALKNKNISNEVATKIWDEVVDKFQGYGFNLSHSILYSLTSYQTAYLKAHFPVEFLLANLKSEVKSPAKQASVNIAKIKAEIKRHKVTILPPNINHSQLSYTMHDAETLVTGLDALKFVGDDAINDLISKRPFKDFFDFMVRCDSSVLRSNSIQALASTGCLDGFKIPRKLIFLYCSDYRLKLKSWLKKHNPETETFNYPWPQEPDWTLSEKYALEKEYLGEAFICGKRDAFGNFFKDQGMVNFRQVKNETQKMHISSMKAEIKSVFEFKVKKPKSKLFGRDMAKATVEDVNGDQFTITIFPDSYDLLKESIKRTSSKQKFEEGIAIQFSGFTNVYEDEVGILLDRLFTFSPTPALPIDLKSKKVSLRVGKGKIEKSVQTHNKEQILEDIEDEMFDEGLIEFEDDQD